MRKDARNSFNKTAIHPLNKIYEPAVYSPWKF